MKLYIFQICRLENLNVLSMWLIIIALLSTTTSGFLFEHNNNNNNKLELVQVLFRHGERTPSEDEYSKVPYISPSVYEPYGFGQLTNKGRMQAYELGSVLRKRYANYLDDVYHAEDLYAYSSESDRSMMTMQLVLAGLYPPTNDFQWNPVLNWHPIPYIYTPTKFDVLLKPMTGKKFMEIQIRETAELVLAKIDKEYSDIMQILENQFGLNLPLEEKLIVLSKVHNVMHANEQMSIPLPEWCTRNVLARLKAFIEFGLDCYSYTSQMKRMNGGPLIKKFVDNMNLHETLRNPRKIYLYSGHDFNIAAVAKAFRFADFGYPDYASTIILEKLRDVNNNRLYVKAVSRRRSGEQFETLKIGNCSELCPVEEFLAITKESIPSDEEMHHMEREFQGSLTNDLFLNDPYVKK